MTVADVILAQNARWFIPNGPSVLTNPIKGTTMHRISPATAVALADIVIAGPLPIPYALACIDIEGIFDPDCMNGNMGPKGSNESGDPEGFDVGIVQLKLRYLMISEHLGLDEARAFALNPAEAIPYFMRTMEGNLQWADSIIAGAPKAADPGWLNRFMLATCAYNFGRTGAKSMLEKPIPSHGTHVRDMERLFATQLAMPSVFP